MFRERERWWTQPQKRSDYTGRQPALARQQAIIRIAGNHDTCAGCPSLDRAPVIRMTEDEKTMERLPAAVCMSLYIFYLGEKLCKK